MLWIAMTPLAVTGFLCVLVVKKYTLKRNFVKAEDQKSAKEVIVSPALRSITDGDRIATAGR